jgi:hypothetical protein
MSIIAAAIAGIGSLGIGGGIAAGAGIGGLASIFGAYEGNQASQNAQQTLAQSRTQGISAIQQLLGPLYGAIGTAGSGGQGGTGILGSLSGLLTPGANQTTLLSQLPGFQFQKDVGNQSLMAQGTTRGLGGNQLAAGEQFGTGLAQSSWGSLVSPLQQLFGTLSGSANNAASAISGIYTGTGSQIAQTQIGQGQALAAGATGVANAASGGINSGINYGILSQLLKNQNNNSDPSQPAPADGVGQYS